MYYDDYRNYWHRADINSIVFLLLIIVAENTIFLLTFLYFLFF